MSIEHRPISRLRQRMIEDMRLRKLSEKTEGGYLRWVKRLNGFLKRSPATATAEDLRRFQLDLVERGVDVVPRVFNQHTQSNDVGFKKTPHVPSVALFEQPADVH